MGSFTIAGRRMELGGSDVEARMSDELPEPLHEHFVVVGGRRFPPKQVLALVTGLDRADFTTHQARNILSRLGFAVARRTPRPARETNEPSRRHLEEADALRPFAGRWVAQRAGEVIVAADTPQQVIQWLERHRQQADAMFRVPVSAAELDVIAAP